MPDAPNLTWGPVSSGTGYQQGGQAPTDVVMDTIMAFVPEAAEPQKLREVSGPKSRNRHRAEHSLP